MPTYTIAVTDEDGTVLDSYDIDTDPKSDTPVAVFRQVVLEAADDIRVGLA